MKDNNTETVEIADVKPSTPPPAKSKRIVPPPSPRSSAKLFDIIDTASVNHNVQAILDDANRDTAEIKQGCCTIL